jgi:hypothetical protein
MAVNGWFQKLRVPSPQWKPGVARFSTKRSVLRFTVQKQNDIASVLGSVIKSCGAQTERAAMNAYLFSAGYTTTQVSPVRNRSGQLVNQIRTWDSCESLIICGSDAEQAQKQFEDWLSPDPDAEHPAQVEIKRVVAAQFVDQLLTESGDKPLDWPQISEQNSDSLQATSVDDFEQGYWVDIHQALPPGKISSDLESLKRDLPEDIRSGLNWSPDRQFFFLLSILSPLPMPEIPADEPEAAASDPDSAEDESQTNEEAELDVYVMALAEMRDKEAAALVQARNSVVAAWLWRKYAANTRLALNEIHIAPCCNRFSVE